MRVKVYDYDGVVCGYTDIDADVDYETLIHSKFNIDFLPTKEGKVMKNLITKQLNHPISFGFTVEEDMTTIIPESLTMVKENKT